MSERGNRIQKFLDRYVGIPLTVPVTLFRKFERKRIEPSEVKKMGIICFGAIGDLLLLSTLVNSLKLQDPDIKIDLILSQNNAVAASLLSNIENIYAYPIKDISKFIKTLRQQHYDLLIDSSQWARIGSILSGLSKAKMTIGFRTAQQWRALPYDISVEHRNDWHEWQNFHNLGRHFFVEFKEDVPKIIANHNNVEITTLSFNAPFIVCHMWPAGSNISLKIWSEDNWKILVKKLIANGFFILWSGSNSDRNNIQSFVDKKFSSAEQKKMKCIAGELSLLDMGELFTLASACISVNTGIMHLAALVGCPTLGIHGPTNPLRWGPVGEKTAIVSPPNIKQWLNLGFEKITDDNASAQLIGVEQVITALEKLLNG